VIGIVKNSGRVIMARAANNKSIKDTNERKHNYNRPDELIKKKLQRPVDCY
jgi:hypothetical protein